MTEDEREGNGVQDSKQLVVSSRWFISRQQQRDEGWTKSVASTGEFLEAEGEVAEALIADANPDAGCLTGNSHDGYVSLKNLYYRYVFVSFVIQHTWS